jgi:hypothetical protein
MKTYVPAGCTLPVSTGVKRAGILEWVMREKRRPGACGVRPMSAYFNVHLYQRLSRRSLSLEEFLKGLAQG